MPWLDTKSGNSSYGKVGKGTSKYKKRSSRYGSGVPNSGGRTYTGPSSEADKESSGRRQNLHKMYNPERLKSAANRKANRKEYKKEDPTGSRKSYNRQYRAEHGLYRGKYYGPDQFKGDLGALSDWKKAGKPKIGHFLNVYNKSRGKGNR